jgi:hypothetical protein
VNIPKRVWRPKVKFQYEEPKDLLDMSDGLDWMFEDKGHIIVEPKQTLPPYTDLIKYDPKAHKTELDKNIQWRDCPAWCQPVVREIIEEYFGEFAQERMLWAIREFEFHIDTGQVKPITCKIPVYGDHEERVIQELVKTLQHKGLIEDNDRPWGSPIMIASKPNQSHIQWLQYVFRLCVSYRTLNDITRPFLFPVRRCDNVIEQIGAARHVITMDLDAGYWQMKLRDSSRSKTAFYTPRGKKRWQVTPMGATNANPAFAAMAMRMEDKWRQLYKKIQLNDDDPTSRWLQEKMKTCLAETSIAEGDEPWDPTLRAPWQDPKEPKPKSAVIVDDILLATEKAPTLFFYLSCVLSMLQFYRVTVKLQKTRCFPWRAEFIGADLLKDGKCPAEAKNETITNLKQPTLFTNLRMLIGFMGFL